MTETLDPPQESMMKARPQQEHAWLHRLVGEWEFDSEMIDGSGMAPVQHRGTEVVRSIGELWIQGEGQIEMPGGHETSVMTLGYDPQKGRFVGTWLGSMMASLWVYDGTLDAAERVLTLESEGPSFVVEGAIGKYQDVIEIVSDDHRTMTSRFLGDDGEWHPMMRIHFRRKA
jgi:hypothetical protein